MLLGSAPIGSIPVGAQPGAIITPAYLSATALLIGNGNNSLFSKFSVRGEALIAGSAHLQIKAPAPSMAGVAALNTSAYTKLRLKAFAKATGLIATQAHGSALLRTPIYLSGRALVGAIASGSAALTGSALPIYPVLRPLAWPVHKKPIMASRVTTAITGRETQLAGAAYPRWAFTLTYGGSSWLRDQTQNILPDPTKLGLTEFEQLSALYIYCKGPYGEFYFEDPDDNSRLGAPIAVGNGSTTSFPIYVPWGFGPFSPSFYYPVGGINTIDTVYINGVVQPTSAYQLDFTRTQLIFTVPPVAGAVITSDFHFYFRCRFLDDHLDFSQWAQNLWECAEVRFESIKP